MLNYTALEKLEKQANQGADKTVLNPEFKNWSTKQKCLFKRVKYQAQKRKCRYKRKR